MTSPRSDPWGRISGAISRSRRVSRAGYTLTPPGLDGADYFTGAEPGAGLEGYELALL